MIGRRWCSIMGIMKGIKETNLVELSNYLNAFRSYFASNGFFEQTLYSTVPYAVTNTETFKLKEGVFLRHFPEPEIWVAAEQSDKFFWIGSLFRNEKKLTKIHSYEFKIVDFYIKGATMKDIVRVFFESLDALEHKLSLGKLSKMDVKYISYEDFDQGKFDKSGRYWAIITDYPKDESFYDAPSKDSEKTSKFEVMFVDSGNVTEIAAAGIIGENLNSLRKIDETKDLGFSKEIYAENFIGLGFGVERLMYLYKQLS
jgi:aspartyl/asparaginyl-tRNA synthetase